MLCGLSAEQTSVTTQSSVGGQGRDALSYGSQSINYEKQVGCVFLGSLSAHAFKWLFLLLLFCFYNFKSNIPAFLILTYSKVNFSPFCLSLIHASLSLPMLQLETSRKISVRILKFYSVLKQVKPKKQVFLYGQ